MFINQPQIMDGCTMLTGLASDSIPLVFFDPQYRSILNKQKYGNEGNRQKERFQLPQMNHQTIKKFLEQIERILVPSGHLMMWIDKFILCEGLSIYTDGTIFKQVDLLTWDKQKIGMGYRTRRKSEYLVIFQKPPVRAKGVWKVHSIPDVWPEKATKEHPHAKPIGLLKKLIEAVTNVGDIVVDPCAGGYGVLRATSIMNRQFIGCDLLPHTFSPEERYEIQYLTAPMDQAGYITLNSWVRSPELEEPPGT
jgi:site-specific DNA-methyltransferase (adenine-specific)